MEMKIKGFIEDASKFTFERNSYQSSFGTYSKAGPELQVWLTECEDFIENNYKGTLPWKIFQKVQKRHILKGFLKEDFDEQIKMVILSLESCLKLGSIENNNSKKNISMEEEVVVFISHGRSRLWNQVARFIDKKLEMETVELAEQTNRGRTIIEKFEEEVDFCNYAIVVMTAEDEQAGGEMRARENVIHEIGYLQGVLGRENVLVLKQNGITPFSNISGIVYVSFENDNIEATFERIRQELEDFEERLDEE